MLPTFTSATQTLVQSIPRFTKDGAVEFFLAPGGATNVKFDPSAGDGIGGQIKDLHALGSSTLKKLGTRKSESFSLTVHDALQQRIANGGKLCEVIVPADSAVAATYFGANESAKDMNPRLTLDAP